MKTTIMTLHAQTAIHAGSGQSDSVIDLPVQREPHTKFPCIFGSSMKGALRAHAETRCETDEKIINQLFGDKNGDGNAGALLISDARLLLLPVRSLTGQFRWVTCPAILKRYKADMQRFGLKCDLPIPKVQSEEIFIPKAEKAKEEPLYLEEYRFNGKPWDMTAWVDCLAVAIDYDDAQAMLTAQLGILCDNDFAYLATYTLPVSPHIAIDSSIKTTRQGALWYEETLSPDSVLYVGIAADEERKENGKKAHEVMTDFQKIFSGDQKWLQIGGNETVGMGWCSVKFAEEKENGHTNH